MAFRMDSSAYPCVETNRQMTSSIGRSYRYVVFPLMTVQSPDEFRISFESCLHRMHLRSMYLLSYLRISKRSRLPWMRSMGCRLYNPLRQPRQYPSVDTLQAQFIRNNNQGSFVSKHIMQVISSGPTDCWWNSRPGKCGIGSGNHLRV